MLNELRDAKTTLFGLAAHLLRCELDRDLAHRLACLPVGELQEHLASFDAAAEEEAAEEFTRLFILPGGVAPRGAAWVAGELETAGAELSRKAHHWLDALSRDLDPTSSEKLPLDHVSLLLELGSLSLGTESEEAVMDDLVRPWVPGFSAALEAETRLPIYAWLAKLLRALVAPGDDRTTRSPKPRRLRLVGAALLVSMGWAAPARAQSTPSPEPEKAPASEASAPEAPAKEAPKPEGPWRLHKVVGSPDWFKFGAQHRSRGEYIIRQFRADRAGDGGLLSFRTGIAAELQPGAFLAGVELMDSRAYFANDSIALNTTHMNPIELLQGYVGLVGKSVLEPEDKMTLRVGRLTMDIGSRRLMARNRYRNTINTFTGFDAVYQRKDGLRVQGFSVFPVQRRPGDREALIDNDIVYDRETFDFIHSGVVVTLAPMTRWNIVLEGYAFGTLERDGEERATKDRRLFTPGFRFFRKPVAGEFDFTFEMVAQVGRSRSSRADDNETDLSHLAMFQHASAGYTADVFGKPRFAVEYDHASGDDNRADGQNNRFETLFGARRFDFGPTGIYGAVARSNIRTPGVRIQWKPLKMLRGFVGYRAFWLDEAADGWTTSGVTAGAGQDATFVGHQVEARLRFDPWPGNLRVEPGVAHLFPGAFLNRSDNANESTDTTMLYLQLIGKI